MKSNINCSLNSFFSDHAWGGNYFIAGGEIDGKKILGSYPDNLSNDGPQVFEPGIVIPSLPWDSVWNGVAQWFGITDTNVSWQYLHEMVLIFITHYAAIFFIFIQFNSRIWMR